jgi:hypothetical protein
MQVDLELAHPRLEAPKIQVQVHVHADNSWFVRAHTTEDLPVGLRNHRADAESPPLADEMRLRPIDSADHAILPPGGVGCATTQGADGDYGDQKAAHRRLPS